jgi:hypothetical protein
MAAIFLQALSHKDKFPEAFQTIAKASLVDDMAYSRPTLSRVQELVQQLVDFFPKCAMEIRKFCGNSHKLMKDLRAEQRIEDLQDHKVLADIFNGTKPASLVKVLGLIWDYVRDVLGFNFSAMERAGSPITKVDMLTILHTLYDLLGILIPSLVTGKLLVRECWRLELAWKDNVPQQIENNWFK